MPIATLRRRAIAPYFFASAAIVSLGLVAACASKPPTAGSTQSPLSADDAAGDSQAAQATGQGSIDASVVEDPNGEPITAAQAERAIPYTRFNVPLDDSPRRGPEDAAVTIVMFSDFECPFCQRGQETLEQIEQAFPGQIRIVYRAYPISQHQWAMLAALMAESANAQGKFWPFVRELFSGKPINHENLESYIAKIGLDKPKLLAELDELTFAPRVNRDLRLAQRLGVRSTPTFFLNGRMINGALPFDNMRALVEEELEVRRAQLDKGVQATEIYAALTSTGFTSIAQANGETAGGVDFDDTIYPIPVGDSPQIGPSNALVTVVMFADFECPFCTRGSQTVANLMARYPTKLRVVYKFLPLDFHKNGQAAARVGAALAHTGRFWEFYSKMITNGPRFGQAEIETFARAQGLSSDALQAAVQDRDPLVRARLTADQELAIMHGISGTPTFFVNGKRLDGAIDELAFRFTIVEELERAQKVLAQGVPADQLYNTLTGIDHHQVSAAQTSP